MTKKNQTAGPVNMASYDAMSAAAGELALAKSSVFHTHNLRLYRGLKVNDGKPVDYLVCTPQTALLGIQLTNANGITPAAKEGHVPIAKVLRTCMKNGDISYLETELYRILRQNTACPTLSVCQIPRELYPKLAGMRMVQHPNNAQLWEPTSYGASLGIFQGYLGGAEAEHALFTLNKDVLNHVQETLDWKPQPTDTWDIIPLEQRLKKLSQGRSGNSAYAAAVTKTLADTPLSGLLAQYPNELDKLLDQLNGPLYTFQDAAFQIGKLMHGSKQEKALAGTLAVALTKPLIKGPVTICSEEDLVESFCERMSWADRIARCGEEGYSLLSVVCESFPTILEGAAVLSGQPYLLWLIQEILNEKEILNGNSELLRNSFRKMLWGAKTQMDSKDLETAALGRNLLLKLAIEPFYLMRLSKNAANHLK